jgi:hypothetical protein
MTIRETRGKVEIPSVGRNTKEDKERAQSQEDCLQEDKEEWRRLSE